jgi:RNA polymerase sigma factor (sigma-70 family)
METATCPIEFSRLYRNYSLAIRSKIGNYIKDGAAADDVFQEIFLKVWMKMPTYDPMRGSVFSWLNAITTSCCIDHLRRPHNKSFADSTQEDILNLVDHHLHPDVLLLRHELSRLSGNLSPALREIVVFIYYRGHTQEEAAAILRLPLGTVKSRQRRALQIMRTEFLNAK